MSHTLDSTLLPEFEFTATFMCLPQVLETALQRFPETLERIDSSLMFCAKLTYCDPKKDYRAGIKAGRFLRAALTEYASIEEGFNRRAGGFDGAAHNTSLDRRAHGTFF